MKKVIVDTILRCTDIIEVEDEYVDSTVKFNKDLNYHRDIANSIKAEFDLDNCTVDDVQIFVTEGETIRDSAGTKVKRGMDWLMTAMGGHFNGAITHVLRNILDVVKGLEEENARLKEELNNRQ